MVGIKILRSVSIVLMLVLVFSLTACTEPAANPAESADYSYEGALRFTGLANEFEVAFNDIYAMESVDRTITGVTSAEEVETNHVTGGVLLETLLAEHGVSKADYSMIRLIAGDGYAIDVPAEVLHDREIILAFEYDGQFLDDKKQPLRVAIDDVRTMYYVSNLAEINFSAGSGSASTANKVVVFETAANGLDTEDYVYYDSTDQAIKVADLYNAYVMTAPENVEFMAADGFEKSELYETLMTGYFKVTGENVPMFTAPDLPKGMMIKQIMKMDCGDVMFVSFANAIDTLTERTVGDYTGAALEEVFTMLGLKGETYTLTATDGYSADIRHADLELGIAYLHPDGFYSVKFDSDELKSASIKDLLTIEVTKGDAAADTVTPDDGEEPVEGWIIAFDGLSDGSFDFDQDRAERKLILYELQTNRIKNDSTVTENWKGYKVLDVLAFLHVDTFESLTFSTDDGFDVTINSGDIDDDTIFAVEEGGEAITPNPRLVQNTEFSTTWVKGVTKVTIK